MRKAKGLVMVILLALPLVLFGQPAPEFPPHDPPPMGPGGGRHHPGEGPPASPLRQWMKQLREENPDEFQRLQKLRRENPAAFRKEARNHFESTWLGQVKKARPGVYEALVNLPAEDREWLMERLVRPGMMPPGHPGRHEPPPPDGAAGQIRQRVRQYKESASDAEKKAIREDIRKVLDEQYDRRLENRERQLEEAEDKLEAARRSLEQGGQEKEAFIEEKMADWLGPADE